MHTKELNDANALAEAYAEQKWKALRRVGIKRDLGGMLAKSHLHIKKTAPMAKMLNEKGIAVAPGVVMEACFEQARRDKHPDGPYPNSLSSWKYVRKALSALIGAPQEASDEIFSVESMLRSIDDQYTKQKEAMATVRMFHMLSSVPVEFKVKYFLEQERRSSSIAGTILPELLDRMTDDPLARLWIESRVGSYEHLAQIFNER